MWKGVAGWWFSPGTPVSSTNKTDRHNILLIVALSTIKLQVLLVEETGVPGENHQPATPFHIMLYRVHFA
jgi:hypothetical protein